ncbi:MAG: hypothetical protein RL302_1892 [Pseudomonadota bacterium]|jgi:hypothetical protein
MIRNRYRLYAIPVGRHAHAKGPLFGAFTKQRIAALHHMFLGHHLGAPFLHRGVNL